MSKETYIGGDYIETTGGKCLNYAKGGIEISSEKEVLFNAANGIFHGVNSPPPVEEITLEAKALVVFRPHSAWQTNYDFGFDWYREGFTQGNIGSTQLKGDENLQTTAGYYLNNSSDGAFIPDASIAERLKTEFQKAHAERNNQPYDYFIPKLTLYKHENENSKIVAHLSVNFEVYEAPDKFILEYEEDFFEITDYVSPNEIVLVGKRSTPKVEKVEYTPPMGYKTYNLSAKKTTQYKTKDVTIECKKPFGRVKTINAYTLQAGADPKNPVKKLAGVLQIMPNNNSYRKIVNVVMINVITDTNADEREEFGYDSALLEKEKKTIKTYLRQSLIDPVFSIIDLDLSDTKNTTKTTRDHFNRTYISEGTLVAVYDHFSTKPEGWKDLDEYLYDEFKKLPHASDFENHTRLFYLPQRNLRIVRNNISIDYGGYNSGSNNKNIVLPKQGSKSASSHEIYHSLGLPHTWESQDHYRADYFSPTESNGKYSFKFKSTYNLMDYVFPQYYLYYWQSKIAQGRCLEEPNDYIPEIL